MGTFDPVRKVYRANFNKYSEKGTSDILGIWRGKMLCIEVKSATGRLRPEQKDFLDTMGRLGAITLLARSLQCVLDALAVTVDTPNKNHLDSCEK
jgi:putative heme degradation protein